MSPLFVPLPNTAAWFKTTETLRITLLHHHSCVWIANSNNMVYVSVALNTQQLTVCYPDCTESRYVTQTGHVTIHRSKLRQATSHRFRLVVSPFLIGLNINTVFSPREWGSSVVMETDPACTQEKMHAETTEASVSHRLKRQMKLAFQN